MALKLVVSAYEVVGTARKANMKTCKPAEREATELDGTKRFTTREQF